MISERSIFASPSIGNARSRSGILIVMTRVVPIAQRDRFAAARRLTLAALLTAACGCESSTGDPVEQATRAIETDLIHDYGRRLSADAMAGRHHASPEADSAASFTSDGAFDALSHTGVTVSAPSEHRLDPFSEPTLFGCLGIALHGVRSTTLILPPLDPTDPNTVITSRQIPAPEMGCPCEAVGTSFAAPHVAGVVARIMQLGLVEATGNSSEVEAISSEADAFC